MKIAIVAGGTGGHIYPGMAIAEEISRRFATAEILFIGSEAGLEKDLVAAAGFKFKAIKARGVLRQGLSVLGFFQSLKLLGNFRPRLLISTGGYVALPVVLAAKILKIPVFIQEQNVFLGLTNRLCRPLAKKIFLSFEASTSFPRSCLVGNPVRRAIIAASREAAKNKLGLAAGKKMLLVVGGSQGARWLNTTLLGALPQIEGNRWEFFHVIGQRDFNSFTSLVDKEKYFFYHAFPYLPQMAEVLAAADLVVSRAGGSAIAEFLVRGLPMILVPFPYAAQGHQSANAQAVEAGGAARVIKNADFTPEKLVSVLSNGALDLEKMAAAARQMARPEAARRIVDELGL